jgi:release factor glutamine methyltransferase
VLELAPDQARPLWAAAEAAGYADVAVHRDLAGRDRVLVARRPGGAAA